MQHSPTPWRVAAEEPFCPELIDAKGNRVKGIKLWEDDAGTNGNDLNDLPRANHRHLVACVNANSQSIQKIERLEYALGQIGSFCAGTQFQNVADIALRILAGESMQDIRELAAEESAALRASP